jgi:hypothetical protein
MKNQPQELPDFLTLLFPATSNSFAAIGLHNLAALVHRKSEDTGVKNLLRISFRFNNFALSPPPGLVEGQLPTLPNCSQVLKARF